MGVGSFRDRGVAIEALALLALSFAGLLTVGAGLAAHGIGGVVADEVVCVLLPTVAWVAWRRLPAAEMGLDAARPTAALGALVAGAGAFYLMAGGVEVWIQRVWPVPPAVERALREMIIPAAGARPLAVDLALLALVPAVSEELLFRGVVLGALRPRLGAAGAIVASALAFAVYHASPYKLVPTLLAGLLLGVVRVASGSLLPAIAFHFAVNAGVIVALHLGYDTPPAGVLPIALAVAALLAGGSVVVRAGRSCRA